jgi:subtilase family serine protease
MDAAKQQLIDDAIAKIASTKAAMDVAESELNTAQANVTELERQYNYHIGNNNQTDANIVMGQLTGAKGIRDIALNKFNQAKTAYQSAQAAYTSLANTLLTPAEKAESDQKAAAAVAPPVHSSSVKTLVIVGVVVALIIIGVVVFRKLFKK